MSCLPKCRKKCSKKGCKKGCKKCCRCCRCCRKYNTVEVQTDVQVPSASSAQNVAVQPLLTDLYQIKMAYAYWKAGKANDRAVFDLFFRKNPFQGEFTIFAGLVECLRFLESYTFSNGDLNYLKQTLPASVENEFYEALSSLTAGDVTVYAIKEGTVVFPRVPLIRVEGPLMIAQLLETTLLNLVNFASLMTTNAVRYRILTGDGAELVEFGLRRAQGPDGGLSASKYSYVGGFNATSNVLAGKLYGIPVRGAHAHSYVLSFSGEVPSTKVTPKNGGAPGDLFPAAKNWRSKLMCLLKPTSRPHDGEFVAFVSFAVAFPEEFIALVDTYDVQSSGLINFCAVALALNDLGYQAVGVRIDNGKLSCLSNLARKYFVEISRAYGVPWFAKLKIMISNEINEELIVKLAEEGNEITSYGIGTHLVTCQKQPAMGCVYKLVELNGEPKIKLSHGQKKFTLPGKKAAYRLYNAQGQAVVDLLQPPQEAPPPANQKILCRHPYEASKCSNVIPARVENLHAVVWKGGKLAKSLPSLDAVRNEVEASLKTVREEVRSIFEPVTYKVSVSGEYYKFLQDFWAKNAPTVDI